MDHSAIDRIESTKNPRIKAARALHTVKGRDRSGMFLCEGEHMVQEAVRAAGDAYALSSAFALGSAFAIETLFVDDRMDDRFADLMESAKAGSVFLVPEHVLAAISTVKSPQGIVAVVRLQPPPITFRNPYGMLDGAMPRFAGGVTELADELDTPQEDSEVQAEAAPAADDMISPSVFGDRLVLLENVQDPGNVGTILRTMDAAGFTGAVLTPGCADPFSPKALRATMGSIFRVPTMQMDDAVKTAAALAAEGYAVVAAALDGTDFFAREPLPRKVCLIIGNEGAGITADTMAAATHRYRLPMRGGAESLNASIAAAVFMYEIAFGTGSTAPAPHR